MKRGWGEFIFAAVILLAAITFALLPPQIALNPPDSDAVAFGKVRVIGGDDGAFLNLRPHAQSPLSTDDSGLYLRHSLSVHQFCFRADGDDYCVDAIQVP